MSEDSKWRSVRVSKITLSESSLHADVKGDEQIRLVFEILRNWVNEKDTGITVVYTKKDRFLMHTIERQQEEPQQ